MERKALLKTQFCVVFKNSKKILQLLEFAQLYFQFFLSSKTNQDLHSQSAVSKAGASGVSERNKTQSLTSAKRNMEKTSVRRKNLFLYNSVVAYMGE